MAAKQAANVGLAELAKRCPPNQIKKFAQLSEKTSGYKQRLMKYPENLPPIDWEYYRKNVRSDYVRMVDDFEKKYKDLNEMYNKRHQLDTSKYFMELEKKRLEVQNEVKVFLENSEKRICEYQSQIKRLRLMIPYSEMTAEEFCTLCPHKSPYFTCDGKPSFWPHTEDEQKPGPVGAPKLTPKEAEKLAKSTAKAKNTPAKKEKKLANGTKTKVKAKSTNGTKKSATKEKSKEKSKETKKNDKNNKSKTGAKKSTDKPKK